jgi:hypothetical protein
MTACTAAIARKKIIQLSATARPAHLRPSIKD